MGAPDQSTATTDFEPEDTSARSRSTLARLLPSTTATRSTSSTAPGFFDFAGQVSAGCEPLKARSWSSARALSSRSGTEVAWEHCNRTNKPRIVVINKLDKENADFYGAVTAMRETLSPSPVPAATCPSAPEQDFRGIVDLLHVKAFVTTPDGKGTEVPCPTTCRSSSSSTEAS